jgi:hypothetical protein
MNVAYIEQLQKEATEKKLDSRAKWMLLRADLVGENTVFVHDPEFDSTADAVGFAQQLSLAGINELYVSSSWSNQMDNWMAMDSFGLKLRGIESIKNPAHERNNWAPECVPAFRFSFKD